MFCSSSPQTYLILSEEQAKALGVRQMPLCLDHAYVVGGRIGAGELEGFDLYEGLVEFDQGVICFWEMDWPACAE